MTPSTEIGRRAAAGSPALATPRWWELAVALGALALLTVGLQLHLHSYAADFGDDEASHYISGLMIHDYLRSGLGNSPIAFVKAFHSHYPLVGIGHWGPLYYGVEALWMLVFSPSLVAVLALSATVSAGLALGIYVFAGRLGGRLAGAFAAAAFVLSPLVQGAASELMLDLPIALLCFAAMAAYARYLESSAARYSVAFALCAAAAMLIKGNGACLALLPPLALLLSRRLDLLRRGSFWLPVPIVAVLVGPWYVVTYSLVAAGFRYHWGWDYVVEATVQNGGILLQSVGWPILVAALVGLVAALVRAARSGAGSARSAAAALLLAVWVFQSVVPAAIQARYLAPLLPPLLILAADGIRAASAWAQRRSRWNARSIEAVLAVLLLAAILPAAMSVEEKSRLGFMAAAPQVWQALPPGNRSVLVAADGQGEAAAIAALAMLDPARPSLFAVRGSRLLGGGGYNNQDYVPRFQTPQEAVAAIDDYAIPLVLYRANTATNADWLHLRQIADAQRLDPGHWDEIYRDVSVRPALSLYRLTGNDAKPADAGRLMALSAPSSLGGK